MCQQYFILDRNVHQVSKYIAQNMFLLDFQESSDFTPSLTNVWFAQLGPTIAFSNEYFYQTYFPFVWNDACPVDILCNVSSV